MLHLRLSEMVFQQGLIEVDKVVIQSLSPFSERTVTAFRLKSLFFTQKV
jgi:hypothetical protein